MKRYKSQLLYCCFTLFCITLNAQKKDDNVIVAAAEETYTFSYNKEGQVQIEENSSSKYESIKGFATITLAEFYNNQTEIRKLNIKGIKGIKPQYSMYKHNDLFYSDAKVCYFDLPFSKKGEEASVSFEKIFHDLHRFSSIYFSKPQFIREKTIRLIVPPWMNICIHEQNFGENITKEITTDDKSGDTTYTYRIKNQAAEKHEADMPDRSYAYPHLLIIPGFAIVNKSKESFFESTDDLYKWYRNNLLPVNNDQNVISAKSAEITKGCSNDEAKIKAIFSWVQENIRYIAFENDIAAFKPDDAHEVLRKKYGDCKGMSNLLKSLLIAEGFDARLVWIPTSNIASEFAYKSPVANHMICALYWNEKLYFLDPTVEYMPLGEYSQSIQGCRVLIENGNNYIMEQVPVFSPSLNTDSIYCEYTIENDILKGKAKNTYQGESKQIIMMLIHSIAKEKQVSSLKRFLEDGKVQDKIENIQLSGTESQSEKVSVKYDKECKSGIKIIGNELYIDLNRGEDFNMTIDTTKRENDYLFPYKIHTIKQLEFIIPKGYTVKNLPENFTIQDTTHSFSISCKEFEGRIVYRKETTLFDPWIKKEQFIKWNNAVSQFRKASTEQIILVKNNS